MQCAVSASPCCVLYALTFLADDLIAHIMSITSRHPKKPKTARFNAKRWDGAVRNARFCGGKKRNSLLSIEHLRGFSILHVKLLLEGRSILRQPKLLTHCRRDPRSASGFL
jgi:hypothetical protein